MTIFQARSKPRFAEHTRYVLAGPTERPTAWTLLRIFLRVWLRLGRRLLRDHSPRHISKMVLSTVKLGPPYWTKGKTFSATFALAY